MKRASKDIFFYSFKLFSCIITFEVLPLSFIYNLNAILPVSYPMDIACDLAIAQLSLSFLSLVTALVLGFLSLTMYSFLKNKVIKIFDYLINAAAILIIVSFASKYFRFWICETYQIPIFSVTSRFSLIIIIFLTSTSCFFFSKYAKSESVNKILDKLFKGFIATVIAGLVILSLKAVTYIISDSTQETNARIDTLQKIGPVSQTIPPNIHGILKSQPNVILVTFDALAAEDMSLYGYYIKTTPNIDALAKDSYVFDTMIANSNWTRPSVASILTGKYQNKLDFFSVNTITKKMSYNHENFARVLKENGFKTAAIISNFTAHPLQNMTFNDFDYLPDKVCNRSLMPPVERILSYIPNKFYTSTTSLILLKDILSAFDTILVRSFPDHFNEIFESPNLTFKKSLDFILNRKSPFFIWIHIMPPHGPYLPSKKFKYKLLEEKIYDNYSNITNINIRVPYPGDQQYLVDKLHLRYLENIMYADDEFGKFVESLSIKGLLENSILIVSSDHGESFRKGYLVHNGYRLENLYNQFIRIPLIIHMPNQQTGKRIKSNAEHVDLAPTILDFLNINVPKWMEGESLKGAMYDNQITKKPKYSMNFFTIKMNNRIRKGAIAVIKGDYKYIYQINDNREELYDIKRDLYENKNLVSIKKDIVKELKQLVMKKF